MHTYGPRTMRRSAIGLYSDCCSPWRSTRQIACCGFAERERPQGARAGCYSLLLQCALSHCSQRQLVEHTEVVKHAHQAVGCHHATGSSSRYTNTCTCDTQATAQNDNIKQLVLARTMIRADGSEAAVAEAHWNRAHLACSCLRTLSGRALVCYCQASRHHWLLRWQDLQAQSHRHRLSIPHSLLAWGLLACLGTAWKPR